MIAEVMRRSSRLASARAASSLGSGAVEKRKSCKTASRQRRKLSSGNERTVAKKIKTRAGAEAALDKRSRYVQMASDAVAGRRDAEAQALLSRLCSDAGLDANTARWPSSTAAEVVGSGAGAGALPPGHKWRFASIARDADSHEGVHWAAGRKRVVGVDEAGRGPLAGPVVAAACLVPIDVTLDGIFDSKALSERERDHLYLQLVTHPRIEYGVCAIHHAEIDQINILQATYRAMEGAVVQLVSQSGQGGGNGGSVDAVLVDGNRPPPNMAQAARTCLNGAKNTKRRGKGDAVAQVETVVKGDSKVFSIAAASIIAKVTRDRIMSAAHKLWPEYQFAAHKGYPTKAHQALVHRHGPCPIHRMTFAPLKRWWPAEDE